MSEPRPVADDLYDQSAERPRLVGGACQECGAMNFPLAHGCSRCGSEAMQRALLPADGTLWTWTSQEFLPKAPYLGADDPESFQPWLVGLVDLGGVIRVEGRVVGATVETLRFDQAMTTVVVPFAKDGDGNDVLTFAFTPRAQEED